MVLTYCASRKRPLLSEGFPSCLSVMFSARDEATALLSKQPSLYRAGRHWQPAINTDRGSKVSINREDPTLYTGILTGRLGVLGIDVTNPFRRHQIARMERGMKEGMRGRNVLQVFYRSSQRGEKWMSEFITERVPQDPEGVPEHSCFN